MTNDQEYLTRFPVLQKSLRLPAYRQPAFSCVAEDGCDPDFFQLVKDTCKQIDLSDRAQFSALECTLVRYHRMHGLVKLCKQYAGYQHLRTYAAIAPLSNDDCHAVSQWIASSVLDLLNTLVGNAILRLLLNEHDFATWFPHHDFSLDFAHDHEMQVHCASLHKHLSRDGRPFYYSVKKHTATIRGKTRIVVFSPHALKRMTERLTIGVHDYHAIGRMFAYMNDCRYFEPVQSPSGAMLSFYERCDRRSFSGQYARRLLPTIDPNTKYAMRLGYCPVIEEGAFFLCKTVLFPGQWGTPEYGALCRASFAPGVKERFVAACEHLSYNHLLETQDFSLIKWFHKHVPQVIPFNGPLFDEEVNQDRNMHHYLAAA
jgi:hypothetical protein